MTEASSTQFTFMAVHAHPDDEVFGTGGTLAKLSAGGVQTVLVTATLGEVGEIVDPDLDETARQETFRKLGEVRTGELQAAVKALGISQSRVLGFRDSGMAGTEDNHNPGSFHQTLFDEAVKRLVALIREFKPQVLATYDPFGGYGHPDHIQAHRITQVAFDAAGDARLYPELDLQAWQPAKLYYTVIPRSAFQRVAAEMRAQGIDGPWNNPKFNVEQWGTADELVTTRVDVREYIQNKMDAWRAHKTQIAPNQFMFLIPEEQRREMLGYEWFSLARSVPTVQKEELEQDLFAGVTKK